MRIKAGAHEDDDVAHKDVARNATIDAVTKIKNAHEGINSKTDEMHGTYTCN